MLTDAMTGAPESSIATHVSSFYIALVAAIESLMPPAPPASETCASYGKDKLPGVTERFNTFVNDHAIYAGKSSKKKLYNLRSKLAHGGGLLQIDANPGSFDTSSIDERSKLDELATVTREVVIGWLFSQN